MPEFRLLKDVRCSIGESPVWDDRRKVLFFVDIKAPAIHSIRLDGTEHRTWAMPRAVGSIGLGASGRLVVALERTIAVFDPDAESLDIIAELPDEPSWHRLNDGKVGPDGAFWVGSMDDRPQKEPRGSLYRVDGRGRVTRVLEHVCLVSNGLAWSDDGRTMFHSDSRGRWIDRYDFEPSSGGLANRARIATLDDARGRPDGGACDAEGFYWSCGVSAGRLNRFSREGEIVETHPVPVPAPTMPCFCGDDLKTLVITSLKPDDPDVLAAAPQSGSLFIASSPVAGARIARWADA
ncbi:SMP-30/gluconolactonase/LRE family protein [Microvirga lotononidis]|uniref:Gluconolactonase n=1 Tax=Microvirga lotononidis TaxID=864069 RepID=I4YYI0_9HYPH|nr:SMP-30/gluconolactonase/LRE family protein [Microvirga lotononidis]EIM29022.1 gluconolactonase [Microvirga lotononidis]WQO28869.1 SMP-30/gluconolactonase/LRE family protein [Microvirga lotononidis]